MYNANNLKNKKMNIPTITVDYYIWLGLSRKLTRTLEVQIIPQIDNGMGKSRLRICNISFIVTDVEQDLDRYTFNEHRKGFACYRVTATINTEKHLPEKYQELTNELIGGGWKLIENNK